MLFSGCSASVPADCSWLIVVGGHEEKVSHFKAYYYDKKKKKPARQHCSVSSSSLGSPPWNGLWGWSQRHAGHSEQCGCWWGCCYPELTAVSFGCVVCLGFLWHWSVLSGGDILPQSGGALCGLQWAPFWDMVLLYVVPTAPALGTKVKQDTAFSSLQFCLVPGWNAVFLKGTLAVS